VLFIIKNSTSAGGGRRGSFLTVGCKKKGREELWGDVKGPFPCHREVGVAAKSRIRIYRFVGAGRHHSRQRKEIRKGALLKCPAEEGE